MRASLLFASAALLAASCGPGGPTSDISPMNEADVCAAEAGTPAPTPFRAASDTGTAVMHQLTSSATPYTITLPTGAQGFVGIHVAAMHTTMEIIVKHSSDVGPVTMGGAASDLIFDQGAVMGTACADLYYYKLHADTPGDYELQLPSNSANTTWLAFRIVQVGHDLM